jgi:flagellin
MSLVVNTNISSLTAQRSLAESDYLLETAMERLSSGKKINSASDDAAGLAIVERMTAQINGLNMAIKNANDGISLTQSIEGALVEVTDMLQRLRELSVQAANDSNTGTDRRYIQEEVSLLLAEITRVSTNTRYNGERVLDGSFVNKSLQVGTEGGEKIQISVNNVAASALGNQFKLSAGRAALSGSSALLAGNNTTQDDIIINGKTMSRTINVATGDSAKQIAAKINVETGNTGVTALAKTYARFTSSSSTDGTFKVTFTSGGVDYQTGNFVMSSGNASDAVSKINEISGSTGVVASVTSDNKVLLHDSDGDDIVMRVTTYPSGVTADVTSYDFYGTSAIGSAVSLGSGNEYGRVVGQMIAQGPENFSISQTGSASAAEIVSFADGDLVDMANGVANAGSGEGKTANGATGADTYDLTDHTFTNPTLLTVYQDTNEGNGATIVITGTGTDGSAITETFTLGNVQQTLTGTKLFATVTSMTYSDGDAGADAGVLTIGTAPNGQWATGASSLSALGNINLQTQQGSNDAILVIDGAIEKVSSMRAYLGAIENRLEHTVSNLMNVAENTADSRSRIYDADFSVESANLAKAQVLQQVGAAMLTQANARPQLVLQLLQ